MTPEPLRGLPALSAAEAELRTSALAALNGRLVAGVTLRARIPAAPPAARDWFLCDNGAAVALLRLDGAAVPPLGDDGLQAANVLERAEPVLAEAEAALGIALEPASVAAHPPLSAVVIAVDGGDRLQMLVALPPDLALLAAPARFAPELLGDAPVPVTIAIDGPRLAPHDAASLGAGDLLLLGPGPLAARLSAPGVVRRGSLDPATRSFRTA